jgi:hypothetical protein
VTQHFATFEQNLDAALSLALDVQAAYIDAPPSLRRRFNRAFFTKIYIDEDGTVRADLAEPFGTSSTPRSGSEKEPRWPRMPSRSTRPSDTPAADPPRGRPRTHTGPGSPSRSRV